MALACAAGSAVLVAAESGGGLVRGALVLLVLVLAPTATGLPRRLAVNLVLAVGWLPLLAVAPAVLPGGRVPWALAVTTSAIVVARVRSGSPARLMPVSSRHDLAIVVAPLVAGVSAWPLLAPRSPERVLAGLMRGWDHAGHFAMYYDQRVAGVAPPWSPGPADGSGWEFATYPQWLHGLMSLLAEVAWGGEPGTALEEIGRYAQLNWVLYVLTATLLVTTLLALTGPAGPASSTVVSLALAVSIVAAPGARLLLIGYGTFLLVAVTVACAIVLVASGQRRAWSTTWVLSAGVVTSSAWLLLLPLTGTVALFHLRDRIPGSRFGERAGILVVALLTALPVTGLLLTSAAGGAGSAVNLGGEVTRLQPVVVFALLGLVVATATAGLRRRRCPSPAGQSRMVLTVALVALAELVALGSHQLLTIGRLEYYWWKLGTATTIVAAVLLACELVRTLGPVTGPRRRLAVAATCTVAGLAGLGVADLDIPAPTPALLVALPSGLESPPRLPQAQALVSVAETEPCDVDAFHTMVLLPSRFDVSGLNADQWFHALHQSRSRNVARQGLLLNDFVGRPSELGQVLSADGWALWGPSAERTGEQCTSRGGR